MHYMDGWMDGGTWIWTVIVLLVVILLVVVTNWRSKKEGGIHNL